ncbi:MAG: DUF4190 domain-containing protein [Armatimonadota bacterium]|nr:MAG: DUF4190 domain-containing protein [Armatimonadota bacterium]
MTGNFQVPPGQPPADMPPPGPPMQPHRGAMILVFGILGILVCCILGIVAWVLGNNDLREMDAGRMDPTGRGLTSAGRILGMISVGLAVLWVILWLTVFGAMIGTMPRP